MTPVKDTSPHPRCAPTCPRCLTCLNPQNALPPGISQKSGEITFVTACLDAGVPLRDVQIAARHSDPRMTTRYDRARGNLDRHANYIVVSFIEGSG